MTRPWEIWDTERVQYYEETYGSPHNPKPKHKARMELARSLVTGETILDVGCGIGHFYPFTEGYKYTGVDSSEDMIGKAKQCFPDADFNVGDAYNLEFPVHDSVVCQSLLIHLPDFETPLREMWSKTRETLVFSIPVGRKMVTKWVKFDEKYLLSHSEPLDYIKNVCINLPRYREMRYIVEPGTEINNTYFKVSKWST